MPHDEKDTEYVKDCLNQGLSLDQALGQLEALKEQHIFKLNLLDALSDKEVVSKIRNMTDYG